MGASLLALAKSIYLSVLLSEFFKCSVTLTSNVHKSQMILVVSSVDAPILKSSPWLPADDRWLINFKPH